MIWSGSGSTGGWTRVGDRVARHRAPSQISPITRRVLAVAGAAAVVVAVLGVGSLLRDGGGTVATLEQMAPEAGADPTAGDQTFDTAEEAATLQGEMQVPGSGWRRERSPRPPQGAPSPRLPLPVPPTTRTAQPVSSRRCACPRYLRSRLAAELLALRDGRSTRTPRPRRRRCVCVDRVRPDRPGSEIDLVALLTVGDDEVEVYVVL